MFRFLELMIELGKSMFFVQRFLYRILIVNDLGLVPNEIERIKQEYKDKIEKEVIEINNFLTEIKSFKNKTYFLEFMERFIDLKLLMKDVKEDLKNEDSITINKIEEMLDEICNTNL